MNPTEAGKNNVRVLRGWAKSRRWKKLTNPQGRPEIWRVNTGGRFEFRLKIKAEPSLRSGLDPGSVLYFNDWANLTISRFDPHTEKWSHLNESATEPLKDLCEVKFANSTICLYGFGKQTGHWMEWKIQEAKMHAEF